MSEFATKTDLVVGDGSPSAPPIPAGFQETEKHPLTEPPKRSAPLSRDSNLVRDLLKKADGDAFKVISWLETMGEHVTPEELQSVLDSELPANVDDIDTAAAQLGAPKIYFCPISLHLFRDPVLLQTGQTYERCAIQRWLAEGGSICPSTGMHLPSPVTLTANVALRQAVEEWAERSAPWMLGSNGRLLPAPESARCHFAVRPSEAMNDADAALAIRLQDEEISAQRRPTRPHSHAPARPRDITSSQYDRIRRCFFFLCIVTIAYIIMFVVTLSKGEWKFAKIDHNPLIGFEALAVRQAGGTDNYSLSDKNEWWRIATSAVMTTGIIHLQWVVCCLWTCGRFLSARMSCFSLGLLYVASSVCGVLLSANLSVTTTTGGASAGAFGLIGAVFVETFVHHKHYRNHHISSFFLLFMSSVGILMGTTPFVDNWTNLGGLLGGICMALALRLTHSALERSAPWIEGLMVVVQVFWFFVVGVFVVLGCVGVYLDTDSRESCTLCRRLNCVETEWWDCSVTVLPPDDQASKCSIDIQGDLTVTFTCHSGKVESAKVPDVSDLRALDRECQRLCSAENGGGSSSTASTLPPRQSAGPPRSSQPVPSSGPEEESALENGNVERNTLE